MIGVGLGYICTFSTGFGAGIVFMFWLKYRALKSPEYTHEMLSEIGKLHVQQTSCAKCREWASTCAPVDAHDEDYAQRSVQ